MVKLSMTGLLLAGLLAGCSSEQQYVTPDRLHRGMVLVLTGIEGRSALNEAICKGLADGGVNWAIEIQDWTSGWGPLYTLRAETRNRRIAKRLAERVRRYRVAYPDRPICLVGQSGGGAMAVWIAESLRSDDVVDGAILINPSISPDYLLIGALERSRKGIVNFYSEADWVLLGLGTTVYGTMDGEHVASAGMTGFEIPRDRPEPYEKLYEIGWERKMAATGHGGGHLSSGASRFIARYVAPLVLAEQWSPELIAELQRRQLYQMSGSPTDSPLPEQQRPSRLSLPVHE